MLPASQCYTRYYALAGADVGASQVCQSRPLLSAANWVALVFVRAFRACRYGPWFLDAVESNLWKVFMEFSFIGVEILRDAGKHWSGCTNDWLAI